MFEERCTGVPYVEAVPHAIRWATGGATLALLAASAGPAFAEPAEGALTGDWSGTSVCVANRDSCADENALYHLKGPDARSVVTVVGSKIVDGREVVMGPPLAFRYDAEKRTLVGETRAGVFRFTVTDSALDGTLTLTSGTVYRRIVLKKNRAPA